MIEPSAAFLRQYATSKTFRDQWASDTFSMSIAIQCREIRLQRGYTQEELAKRSGLKQSVISRIESGRWDGTVATLKKVAVGLACVLRIQFVSHGDYIRWILTIQAEGVSLVPSYAEDAAAGFPDAVGGAGQPPLPVGET